MGRMGPLVARQMRMTYQAFLDSKRQVTGSHGFEPLWLPDQLFEFQRELCEWSLRKGRAALFEDCGLGKTFQQMVWARNVVEKTNRSVLLMTPLGVSQQTLREAEKFGIEAVRSQDGRVPSRASIVVTNYQRLHHFQPADFVGAVCDESSILKNFEGVTKAAVTEFLRKLPYRLLCTATAAPNDYIELGTSSEALGEMGYMDMLGRFFKKTEGIKIQREAHAGQQYRFRGHAKQDFWRWVCSWARAVRKPSDLGYSNEGFDLPPLLTREHLVSVPGGRAPFTAVTLAEQREERRRSLRERCEKVAALIGGKGEPAVAWCHLNAEGDLLEELMPDARQVSGANPDEEKEEFFEAFQKGEVPVLITKPTIAGFGLNWQHCAHQTFFPSHSFEQWYQCTRRSWRYGQTQPVVIDIVASRGEGRVLANLRRKAHATEKLFEHLSRLMHRELQVKPRRTFSNPTLVPAWL